MQIAEDIVRRLTLKFNIVAIVLFGSRCRGDWGPWSDYDLLIIGEFDKNYLDRIGEILELLSDLKTPVEPHPYTLQEAVEMLRKGNPMIVDAIEEGKVLYSNRDYEKLLEAYRSLKKTGMSRSYTSIVLPGP